MKYFTYDDYIDCIHKLRLNAILQIAEEGEKYRIEEKRVKNRAIKAILENEEEVEKIINNFLGVSEKVKKEDLKKWKSNYIINKYNLDEPILIYRQSRTETFFLIEHLETIDEAIPYRILNYCVDIIYEWSKNRKFDSISLYPRVVPIIVYTGKKKWKIVRKLEQKRIGTTVLENYKIDIQLNVIDTNRLTDKFLNSQKSLFRERNYRGKIKNVKPFVTPFKQNLHNIL